MKSTAVKTSAAAVKCIPLVYSSVLIVMTVLTRFAVKLCNGVKNADRFMDTDSHLAISMSFSWFMWMWSIWPKCHWKQDLKVTPLNRLLQGF